MACIGSISGDLRCFFVSNLTNDNDVWVLSQDGAEAFYKRIIDPRINLGLSDAWDDRCILNLDATQKFRPRPLPINPLTKRHPVPETRPPALQ